ncbi:DUF2793 domain-containing protein [Brevundimonas pishanensis]|uniref:DUF2793 domain-containing protein n=1 Tax=Brevundimonas pishanensis TaxID=2896315 RepID=UPI00249F5393|nr:DUF2793 domain-containing protein [Brevundimonas pishanensis]
MTDDSARLGLPYVMAGQLQKHVTVNEALTRLDALVQTAVVSRTRSSPPSVVTEGDLYLVGDTPSGAWAEMAAGDLVRADVGGWVKVEPLSGMLVSVLDEGVTLVRAEEAWRGLGETLGGILQVDRLGVGAEADATNAFSARLNKALWAARPTEDDGDGDLRFTLNKQGPSHTGSILFQSQWSGRAEIGLMGDDDFRFKVSANGTTWNEALRVDRSTGRVWFASGASRRETVVVASSATQSVPAWARWVEAVCIGAGGAGAEGMSGTAATVRHGGGGGGAGGVSHAIWAAEHLGPLNIVVGTGGTTSGAHGGDTTITTHGHLVLKASGGRGGTAGQGGAGGWGTGGMASSGLPTNRAECPSSAGGGGYGGSLSSTDVVSSGTSGGVGHPCGVPSQGGAGSNVAVGGAAPATVLPDLGWLGGGGGGGAASAQSSGFAGGDGAEFGAGGGGGGAGLSAGGAGGHGASGVVRLTFVG